MRRRYALFGLVILGCGVANLASATDQSSAHFQNKDSTFGSAVFQESSTNFQLNGSVDAIVGAGFSPSFAVQSGIPLVPPPTPTSTPPSSPSSGGGGGGGGNPAPATTSTTTPPTLPVGNVSSTIPLPTLTYRNPTFLSHRALKGARDPSTSIFVNGSSNGVTYPSPTTWQMDLPVFLGMNDVYVQAGINGVLSNAVYGRVERRLNGDVDDNHIVDDADLSFFTRAWKKYTPYADFNEDDKIDDADLSLLASHWGMHF